MWHPNLCPHCNQCVTALLYLLRWILIHIYTLKEYIISKESDVGVRDSLLSSSSIDPRFSTHENLCSGVK
jgi:hypothetical protein